MIYKYLQQLCCNKNEWCPLNECSFSCTVKRELKYSQVVLNISPCKIELAFKTKGF